MKLNDVVTVKWDLKEIVGRVVAIKDGIATIESREIRLEDGAEYLQRLTVPMNVENQQA